MARHRRRTADPWSDAARECGGALRKHLERRLKLHGAHRHCLFVLVSRCGALWAGLARRAAAGQARINAPACGNPVAFPSLDADMAKTRKGDGRSAGPSAVLRCVRGREYLPPGQRKARRRGPGASIALWYEAIIPASPARNWPASVRRLQWERAKISRVAAMHLRLPVRFASSSTPSCQSAF